MTDKSVDIDFLGIRSSIEVFNSQKLSSEAVVMLTTKAVVDIQIYNWQQRHRFCCRQKIECGHRRRVQININ